MSEKYSPLEYAEIHIKKYRSYRRFLRGITSKATKKVYIQFMRNFMDFHKLIDYDKLSKSNAEKIDILIEDYMDELDSRGVKAVTIRTNLAGIERFFEMNDCMWHRKRIRRGMKKDTEIPGGEVPITTDEVYNMLSCTKSLRTKALIHFIASTGIRPGALVDPILKMKHLSEMPHPINSSRITKYCYAVRIYDESLDGYWSFLTPEATEFLDRYLEKRRSEGEKLNDESPVFSMMIDRNAKNHHMTEDNIRYIIRNLISISGVKRVKVSKHRYDKAIVYMFRKRFNGILKMENSVNSNIAEKLMAHKRGLDGTYLKPTREETYTEFTKAIPQLTVDPTERQKIEIQKKQEKIDELEEKEKQITVQQESFEQFKREQQEKIEKMQAQMDRLLQTAQNSGLVKQVKISN